MIFTIIRGVLGSIRGLLLCVSRTDAKRLVLVADPSLGDLLIFLAASQCGDLGEYTVQGGPSVGRGRPDRVAKATLLVFTVLGNLLLRGVQSWSLDRECPPNRELYTLKGAELEPESDPP